MLTARLHLGALCVARICKQSRSKRVPRTIGELVEGAGPETLARNAAATAASAARQECEFWLGVLEDINQNELDTWDQSFCSLYIRDLRRKLGIRPTKAVIREQTRWRVSRFREQRMGP